MTTTEWFREDEFDGEYLEFDDYDDDWNPKDALRHRIRGLKLALAQLSPQSILWRWRYLRSDAYGLNRRDSLMKSLRELRFLLMQALLHEPIGIVRALRHLACWHWHMTVLSWLEFDAPWSMLRWSYLDHRLDGCGHQGCGRRASLALTLEDFAFEHCLTFFDDDYSQPVVHSPWRFRIGATLLKIAKILG